MWVRGHTEHDVNATVLDENDPDWGDACEHVAVGGDYDIVDYEGGDEL